MDNKSDTTVNIEMNTINNEEHPDIHQYDIKYDKPGIAGVISLTLVFWVLAIVSATLIIWKRVFDFMLIPSVLALFGILGIIYTCAILRTIYRVHKLRLRAEAGNSQALTELSNVLVRERDMFEHSGKTIFDMRKRNIEENADLATCKLMLENYSTKLDNDLKKTCYVVMAENGDYDAMIKLGRNTIIENDIHERMRWLKKSLDVREDVSVLNKLAEYFEHHDDCRNAIDYYERAIAAVSKDKDAFDKALAMYRLANIYMQIYKEDRDDAALGVVHFHAAEKQLHAVSGQLRNPNPSADYIVELLTNASEIPSDRYGYRGLIFQRLAEIYYKGKLVPQDIPKCIYYYEEAIKSEPDDMLLPYNLAHVLLDQLSSISQYEAAEKQHEAGVNQCEAKEHKHIRSLLKMAAKNRCRGAVFELAEMYNYGYIGTKKCARKALRLYEGVCNGFRIGKNVEYVNLGEWESSHSCFLNDEQTNVAEIEIKHLTQKTANQDVVITFLLGHNPRVGRDSLLQILPPPVLYDISRILWVVLEERVIYIEKENKVNKMFVQ